ncbi:MAG: hypothetical protein LBS65_03900 [Desulfovibrio sp.]|nr:hypothetical protein [Desulfovibrio sp.]
MGLQAHAACARAGSKPRPGFRPYGYPALQGGVGQSGLKAGGSNRKGSSDEITRLAEDIAGGFMVTAPSEKDFRHPESGVPGVY